MADPSPIRVVFIGAGAVNFGGTIGPWDHSRRLEKLGGVQVVAIADPDLPKAERLLETKLAGESAVMYKGCLVVASYLEALQTANPQVAFIGKFAKGGTTPLTPHKTIGFVVCMRPPVLLVSIREFHNDS